MWLYGTPNMPRDWLAKKSKLKEVAYMHMCYFSSIWSFVIKQSRLLIRGTTLVSERLPQNGSILNIRIMERSVKRRGKINNLVLGKVF